MAKGLFTQGMCVLLSESVSTEQLQQQLKSFNLIGLQESMEDDDAPQTLIYEFCPDSNGHLLVTPSSGRWPDDMGDPDESPERFVAWTLGQYGPLAFPGCLARAEDQSWNWDECQQRVDQHTAHVRLLISYVFGVDEPEDDEDR